MPEFHGRQAAQDAWKQDVLAGRIVLEDLDTERYDLYAHQNEDIVRMTPEQLKQRMAEKERMAAAGNSRPRIGRDRPCCVIATITIRRRRQCDRW